MKAWIFILFAAFATNAMGAEGDVSSMTVGVYDSSERALLAPAFMNGVNRYLRRYEPRLVERSAEYVKMQVDYDYLYDVELKVKADEYDVVVTLAQETRRAAKAQAQAAKLSAGVLRAMESQLVRGSRVRDRTHPETVSK